MMKIGNLLFGNQTEERKQQKDRIDAKKFNLTLDNLEELYGGKLTHIDVENYVKEGMNKRQEKFQKSEERCEIAIQKLKESLWATS